ncbi:MAG: decaprenyl-phosphate phosphoribosyltransferase [Vicinamibacterales bacterium]|jgi:4-hydroxybenzoate polyprenyltransferase|nr:decaprenyl-phosphate phosphoribosyltransferase [Acidobacteriota bacterium]MDP6371915.1 decaprenyl-phosphate phosphoribosyltransferase [Vicinamibacterales bacterium]MDP6609508.1 decaprenyl-phosphate phosphoribosyltransferase [Vicinamibacterales bacterium]HAK55692.1 decaprenyl-phosphate phosphoribosyltransferase [Acidobacteriota bacterium]|tara:strand:- start:2412 stop:3356 length:945 start_codon:yes stop_codon:yes gene_type:complete
MARHSLQSQAPPDVDLARASGGSVAVDLLRSLRPHQWTKNLFVFAALVFGQRLTDPEAALRALAAFLVFCGLSGAIYLVNDVADREADRQHLHKAERPIASGRVSTSAALSLAATLGVGCVLASFLLTPALAVVSVAYSVTLVLYTMVLKHIVIVDVMTIAAGFVLRAVAGAVVIDVPISAWLLICTSLLALFIALSKRRHEIVLLGDHAAVHRPSLGEYSSYLLDQMIAVVTASTLIGYTFYTMSPEVAARFGTPWLGLTIPLPLYGIFRYLYLVHQKASGGSPAELLLADRPLLACVALWVVAVVLIVYRPW